LTLRERFAINTPRCNGPLLAKRNAPAAQKKRLTAVNGFVIKFDFAATLFATEYDRNSTV
jgi:hypothetical protein